MDKKLGVIFPLAVAGAALVSACSPAAAPTATTTATTTQTATQTQSATATQTQSATATQTATTTATTTQTSSAPAASASPSASTGAPAGGTAAIACLADNLEATVAPETRGSADPTKTKAMVVTLRNKGPACVIDSDVTKTKLVFVSGPQNPKQIGHEAQVKADPNKAAPAAVALLTGEEAYFHLQLSVSALADPACQPTPVWALALQTEAGDYVVAPTTDVRTCANPAQIMMGGEGWVL